MASPDPTFDALCRRAYPRLVGALSFQVGRVEVAEELAQETLIRAHQQWRTVSQMDRPDAWLHRVAHNLAASWWRRAFAERRANRRTGLPTAAQIDDAEASAIRALVRELPTRQRTVLALRYFAGLSVAETADVMSCAEGTVKSLTHKALARLRTEIDDLTTPDEETTHA